MSLKNGEKKMSKSEPDGCIFLTDEPEELEAKILKAKTDGVTGISYDTTNRKSLANLLNTLALLRNTDAELLAKELCNNSHLQLKNILIKELSDYFTNFKIKYRTVNKNDAEEVLDLGTKAASEIASLKLQEFISVFNK